MWSVHCCLHIRCLRDTELHSRPQGTDDQNKNPIDIFCHHSSCEMLGPQDRFPLEAPFLFPSILLTRGIHTSKVTSDMLVMQRPFPVEFKADATTRGFSESQNSRPTPRMRGFLSNPKIVEKRKQEKKWTGGSPAF